MFATTGDPLFSYRVVECAGVACHLLDRCAVTSAAQGIVRVVVERNVEHRTKIEIESETSKHATGKLALRPNKIKFFLVTQLVGFRGLGSINCKTDNAPAFLMIGSSS